MDNYVRALIKLVPIHVCIDLIILFIVALLICILFHIKRKRRFICAILLSEYLFLLFCAALLYRKTNSSIGCNLLPFWSYGEIIKGDTTLILENCLNLFSFIPLGLMLSIFDKSYKLTLILGVLISFSIETIQYLFKLVFFRI